MGLIEDLKQSGLSHLIPVHCDEDYDLFDDSNIEDRFGCGDSGYDDEYYEEPEVYDNEYSDDSDDLVNSSYWTLGELKRDFLFEDLSDREFLSLSVNEVFGITKGQLKFLDFDLLSKCNILSFIETMRNESVVKEIPSVEQRIKYALVLAFTGVVSSPLYQARLDKETGEYIISIDSYTLRICEDRRREHDYLKGIILNHPVSEAISLLGFLRDYYRNWPKAKWMDENRESPKFEYPIYPKASHIKDLHDKAARDTVAYDALTRKIQGKGTDEHIKEITSSVEYRRFLYKGEKYSIIGINSYEELCREGDVLDHCVASYAHSFARGESFIYALRANRALTAPFFTIEVGEDKGHMTIRQCYTFSDTTDKSDECRKFIYEWAKKKSLEIACLI